MLVLRWCLVISWRWGLLVLMVVVILEAMIRRLMFLWHRSRMRA